MKAANRVEKKTIVTYGAFCALTLVTFMFCASWGRHATSIPLLKLSQVTGTASAATLEQIITACRERAKWACAEEAYVDLFEETKDAEVVARLADMQRKLGKTQQALQSYAAYTNVGGTNAEALFQYAQLLEKNNDTEGALTVYANSVKASGDRLPVRAMTGIVRILMAERRYEEALAQIKEFHNSAGNAENYLNEEADQLPALIKTQKRVARN